MSVVLHQRVAPRQRREPAPPQRRHQQRADAAQHHRAHRAEQAAVAPDSNSPSWLDAPMNTESTALTRPRIASGVSSWIIVWRTTTLTMSAAPVTHSAASDSANEVDRPKTSVARPNTAIAAEQLGAGVARDRPARQHDRHRQRAQRRRAAQQAQAPGADVQDVLGEDRQQRHRAAEQHREQVERDRAQHHLVLPHVAHAGEQRVQAHRLARRRGGVADAQAQRGRQREQRARRP